MLETSSSNRRLARVLVSLAIALGLSACAELPRVPEANLGPAEEYRLGPGDLLSIKFFYTPELNEELAIRPDGRIGLQLIGDVHAANLTPEELATELENRYEGHLLHREIAVIVRHFESQRAYIGGEVSKPRMIQLSSETSVGDAIFAAGGALLSGQLSSVVLLRKGAAGIEAYEVDVKAALRGEGDLPSLRPYDVVFVPKAPIAVVNDFVELYINRIIPKNSSFQAFYEINGAKTP